MADARDARLITYLPSGTYRVSDTISCAQGVIVQDWKYGSGASPANPTTTGTSGDRYASDYYPCTLVGASHGARSRIILADHSPGFADAAAPKPALHFWARSESESADWWALKTAALADVTQADPTVAEPAISYNQMIVNIDLVLGRGNRGAVGIDHQGAQGSIIENVKVDASGSLAGIQKAPGSGGGIHGLTIIGGQYGMLLKGGALLRGTQPVPVVSDVTLKGQSAFAIVYAGRGPLTVVGGLIDGRVRARGAEDGPWNGAMNFVDTVFRTGSRECSIISDRSIYLHDVYFKHGQKMACIGQSAPLLGHLSDWTHVVEYAGRAAPEYPPWLGGKPMTDAIYRDGKPAGPDMHVTRMDATRPPADIQSRHALPSLPSWTDPGVANVRAAPYLAKGDGKTDDGDAIQRAINDHQSVFLPKGEYKIDRPLILKSHTVLFGLSNVLSVISPMFSPPFRDPRNPAPLIETIDNAGADTQLAFVDLRLPVSDPGAYALRWRAGRNSVVRNIRALATSWEPHAPPALSPMIRIEDSGGGRWYDLYQDGGWFNGPDYRHLLVEGTREPLAFYMLNPEHARSEAQVELRNAANVAIYSLKAEGMYTVLWINDCRNIRLYGYGGLAAPRPGWPAIRLENSSDILLANLTPDERVNEPPANEWDAGGGYWDNGGVPSHPGEWFLIADHSAKGAGSVNIHAVPQVLLYSQAQ